MGLAFWRKNKRAGNGSSKPATRPPLSANEDVDVRVDPSAELRTRARHRLIGAAALLLAVAVFVPMVLDPEPKPAPENIPIDIPSEGTPFSPRLSLPPVPSPDTVPAVPPSEAAPPASDAKKIESKPAAAKPAEPKTDSKAAKAAEQRKSEEQRALAALEGKDATKPANGNDAANGIKGKFAVQAAAPASESAARQLAERLKKAGFAPYTEKVDTKDGARHRVRIGPYATRDDAERARERLKSMGISGNLVTL
jgi:DedD protein